MDLLTNSTIYLGLLIAIYSFVVVIYGIYRKEQKFINSGQAGALGVFLLSSLSVFLLLFLLGTSQFQFEYVGNHTSKDLSLIYKLTALWAGNEGSLLLWAFLLSLFNVLTIYSPKIKNNSMSPYINLVMLINIIFFYIVIVLAANPFKILSYSPYEGYGLNPTLWDFGMIIHPITIYLGYVGLSVPFAIAISALILKKEDNNWVQLARKWALFSWLFLSIGNLAGARWAYTELGWGGYWSWDPVENASFMPWLTVTAFLHSIMVQERTKMFKFWNYTLIIISYLLTLFGTYLVRSGILTSVHAFSNSHLGSYFLSFLVIMLIFSITLLVNRYSLLKKDSYALNSILSREGAFLINNLLFLGATLAVFWGTILPLVSKIVKGTKIYVGIPYYNTVMSPFFLSILLLMGIGVLIAWQQSSLKASLKDYCYLVIISLILALFMYYLGFRNGFILIAFFIIFFVITVHLFDFFKGAKARKKTRHELSFVALGKLILSNRKHYGGFIVHIGIALIAIGILGSQTYDTEIMKTVNQGEAIKINNYTLVYQNLGQRVEDGNDIIAAEFDVYKNDKYITKLNSEKRFNNDWHEPSTKIGLYSTLKEDLYLVLNSWENDGRATFTVKINPLASWIWIGGVVSIIGVLIALTGRRYK